MTLSLVKTTGTRLFTLAELNAMAKACERDGAVAFDEGFTAAQGWRIATLDIAMLALLLAIVVIGLKTVGLQATMQCNSSGFMDTEVTTFEGTLLT